MLFRSEFCGFNVVHDFADFVEQSDVIAANRMTEELNICRDKVYSRDIFFRD